MKKTFKDLCYQLEIKPRNKNIYLLIKEGNLIIRANNRISNTELEQLLSDKYQWIKSKLNKPNTKASPPKITEGNTIYHLGEAYILKLIPTETGQEMVWIEHDKFIIASHKTAQQSYINLINTHYRNTLLDTIPALLKFWSDKSGLYPIKVGYRNTKTRWGSCSSKNNISFNIQLAQLPETIIEYIVVHELAHIQHKNHSSQFWNLVAKLLPSYHEQQRQLRQYEKLINIYK